MDHWLIVGAGDVARRLAPWLRHRRKLFALCRDAAGARLWRSLGAVPIMADLDEPASLTRLSGLAQGIFHFAPPPAKGEHDTRTRHLLAALGRGKILPQRLIYISTTGVYGDCGGAEINETRTARPATGRAQRRVDAERQLRAFGRRSGCHVVILRAPGIYANDRLPLERLTAAHPIPDAAADPWTNHIHADDLAHAAWRAMTHGGFNRIYNVVDDSRITLGNYYRLLATHYGLPPPPTLDRDSLKSKISEVSFSFMAESRKIGNDRIKKEFKIQWQFPTVMATLAHSGRPLPIQDTPNN